MFFPLIAPPKVSTSTVTDLRSPMLQLHMAHLCRGFRTPPPCAAWAPAPVKVYSPVVNWVDDAAHLAKIRKRQTGCRPTSVDRPSPLAIYADMYRRKDIRSLPLKHVPRKSARIRPGAGDKQRTSQEKVCLRGPEYVYNTHPLTTEGRCEVGYSPQRRKAHPAAQKG